MLCMLLIASVALYAADDKKTTKKTTTTTKTTASANSAGTEDGIKKNEQALWNAWKDHDNKPFDKMMADNAMVLDDPSGGFQDKPTMLSKMGGPECDVKSFSFGDEHITWVDKDAAIYTYTATVDATCGGQKLPEKIYCASTWAKRGNEWKAILHQETAAMPAMAPPAQ